MFGIINCLNLNQILASICSGSSKTNAALNVRIETWQGDDESYDDCTNAIKVGNVSYKYIVPKFSFTESSAFKVVSAKNNISKANVYLKVITNDLESMPKVKSCDSFGKSVKILGSVFTVMTESNSAASDEAYNTNLMSKMTVIPPTEDKVGFVIYMTKAEFEDLNCIYFGAVGPLTSTEASTVYDAATNQQTMTLNFSAEGILTTPGAETETFNSSKYKLAKKSYKEEEYINNAKYLLLCNLKETFECCKKQGISTEMLKQICMIEQDNKLIDRVYDVCAEYTVFTEECDTQEKCKEQFIKGSEVAAAYACNAVSNTLCEEKAYEICAKASTSPLYVFNAMNVINFYNCSFNNSNLYFKMNAAINGKFNMPFGGLCTPEDFCLAYGISEEMFEEYCGENVDHDETEEGDAKKPSKKRSSSKKSTTSSKPGFMSRNKGWFIAGGIIVVVAVAGGIGYTFL